MAPTVAFSAPVVIGDVADLAVAGLDRLGNERGLDEAALTQLATFEELRPVARAAQPGSRGMYRVNGSTSGLREQLQRCAEATAAGIPLVDLLGMRSAVPADWRRLPLTIDTILWTGVTQLVDDLSLICSAPSSPRRRQEQLASMRDLQGALGRVIRLSLQPSPAEQETRKAAAIVDTKFAKITHVIGNDLAAIRAKAAAIRARPR